MKVFDIVTGKNNPKSEIPNIDPNNPVTIQKILETVVKPVKHASLKVRFQVHKKVRAFPPFILL